MAVQSGLRSADSREKASIMREVIEVLVRGLKPEPGTLAVLAAALGPALVFLAMIALHRRKEKQSDPPQDEKLLRPPGYSLWLKLDECRDKIMDRVLFSTVFCIMGAAGSAGVGVVLGYDAPLKWAVPFGLLFAVCAVLGIWFLFKAGQSLEMAGHARLGLRGEQAVGEVLHELANAGFRVFHDIPGDGDWNIDHVVVGPRGVFVIETKARRRREPKWDQPKNEVRQDGEVLVFPFCTNSKAIPQAKRNAEWLTDHLAKRTSEPVKCEALVALPGWYVVQDYNAEVRAMNTVYLVKYLGDRPEKIEPEQVQLIINALEEKCRTLEFSHV